MIKAIHESLKWFFAGKEMSELERWRVQYQEYRRWLAEFEDVAVALDCLKQEVDGTQAHFMNDVREKIRKIGKKRENRTTGDAAEDFGYGLGQLVRDSQDLRRKPDGSNN